MQINQMYNEAPPLGWEVRIVAHPETPALQWGCDEVLLLLWTTG
jgi:hypothetical protein